jgi:hypothetical protein
VLTTVEPNKAHKGTSYDAYEYTAHSHTYITDDMPSMRVTYDLSPIQVCVCVGVCLFDQFLVLICAAATGEGGSQILVRKWLLYLKLSLV